MEAGALDRVGKADLSRAKRSCRERIFEHDTLCLRVKATNRADNAHKVALL
jgi:hypothetical protein